MLLDGASMVQLFLRYVGLLSALWIWPATGHIAVPSSPQLKYQSTDFVALIHFNMGTYAHDDDPCCDETNWNVHAEYAAGPTSDLKTFDPKHLNTTQWMEVIGTGLGAKIAVLTAKHGCGFLLWPTKATFMDGTPYGYHPQKKKYNVLNKFVHSAKQYGIGYGFYYSVMKSFYLCRSFEGSNSCLEEVLENQHNVSDIEYSYIVEQHLRELWTEHGDLTRVWTDSALPPQFAKLMNRLQPNAAGTDAHPIDWCGTESGYPSRDAGTGPVWNTGHGTHGTVPVTTMAHKNHTTQLWVPKMCDPQLFRDHGWFWEPNLAVRTLEILIPIYHDIVGRGMVMELDFAINRNGLVDPTHETVYRQLGDWVRTCYGEAVASTANQVGTKHVLTRIRAGDVFDRVQVQEDIQLGQRVTNYTIILATKDADSILEEVLVHGDAIGRKRIHLFEPRIVAPDSTVELYLLITKSIAIPHIQFFGAFAPCSTKAALAADKNIMVVKERIS